MPRPRARSLRPVARTLQAPRPTIPRRSRSRIIRAAVDLATVTIPEASVSGKIGGQEFKPDRVVYYPDTGILSLRSGKEFLPDSNVEVMGITDEGESPQGKVIRVAPDQKGSVLTVSIHWRQDDSPQIQTYPAGYALILELGQISGGKLPGKIFLAVPDDAHSTIAGTFVIEGVK